MDERLEKALAFSNYRASIENRRISLKRRFKAMLVINYDNGTFTATQDLITFVSMLASRDETDSIIIDDNENPIKVDDLTKFQNALMEAYYRATNEYSTEIQKLKTARNVKKLMDW